MNITFKTSRAFNRKKTFKVTLDDNLEPVDKSTYLWSSTVYVDDLKWELSYSLNDDYELVFELKLDSDRERTLIPIRGLEWYRGSFINDFEFTVKE